MRTSRLTVVSSRLMRNSSNTHQARSRNRQRTTPWIAGIGPLSMIRASACRCVSFSLEGFAGRLAVDQPLWTLGIKGENPISDGLQPNTADASRIGPGASVVDFRQSKKATSLGGIPGPLRDAPKRTSVEIGPQRDGDAHGGHSWSAQLSSDFSRFA